MGRDVRVSIVPSVRKRPVTETPARMAPLRRSRPCRLRPLLAVPALFKTSFAGFYRAASHTKTRLLDHEPPLHHSTSIVTTASKPSAS